jgi:hypothetical protein
MNAQKVIEALRLIEAMIHFGDAPLGLPYVQKLLAEAVAEAPAPAGWDEDDPDVNPDMNVA